MRTTRLAHARKPVVCSSSYPDKFITSSINFLETWIFQTDRRNVSVRVDHNRLFWLIRALELSETMQRKYAFRSTTLSFVSSSTIDILVFCLGWPILQTNFRVYILAVLNVCTHMHTQMHTCTYTPLCIHLYIYTYIYLRLKLIRLSVTIIGYTNYLDNCRMYWQIKWARKSHSTSMLSI